ncbi:MAG: PilN domain-containing protein [Desulfobacterales bacterium]|jgi:Tfp pilus assembly protein PilN
MALRDVNLIPPHIQTRMILNRHLAFWIGCLMISLSLILSFYLYQKHIVLAKKSAFGNLKDTHTNLGLKIKEIKRIQEEVEKLDQQQAVLNTIARGPVCWRIIQKISEIINESTWLRELTTGSGSEKDTRANLKLSGFSSSNEELGDFLIKLSSETMIKGVLLKFARETIFDRASRDRGDQTKVIEFEIECELNEI